MGLGLLKPPGLPKWSVKYDHTFYSRANDQSGRNQWTLGAPVLRGSNLLTLQHSVFYTLCVENLCSYYCLFVFNITAYNVHPEKFCTEISCDKCSRHVLLISITMLSISITQINQNQKSNSPARLRTVWPEFLAEECSCRFLLLCLTAHASMKPYEPFI